MISFISLGNPSRRWILLFSVVLSLLLLRYLFWQNVDEDVSVTEKVTDALPNTSPDPKQCPDLPGLEDVLVVLKTGVTEASGKVPVHFETTLRCIPHYVLFSDFEEDIAGVHVHDVLRNVDEGLRRTSEDFEIYNRLRKYGRSALEADDISHDTSTPFGKPDNPGWKLDKWKFLPMIDETLNIRNDAKWYVFIEADTYMIWPNLMAWLEKFDPSKPLYLGNQMQIAGDLFAHGGSGFVLSQPAMKMVSSFRASRVQEWDDITNGHWAGDCVLGMALQAAGVNLHWAWPMLQGSPPWEFDFFNPGYSKKPWCYTVVAYHHLTPDDVREMWDFERSWFWRNPGKKLLHKDVFKEFIQPQLASQKTGWDNLSADKSDERTSSVEDCEAHCVKDSKCLQYSYDSGICMTSTVAKRGERKIGVTSGWIPQRISTATKKMGSCKKAEMLL